MHKALILCLLLLPGLMGFKPKSSKAGKKVFPLLLKLEGVWVMDRPGKSPFFETWEKVSNTQMVGKTFAIKGTDTTYFEVVDLQLKHNEIYYIPTTQNQNDGQPVSFKLTQNSRKKFVFENPEHDFPKRIVYEFVRNDSIHAWIDDGNLANGIKKDFFYKQVKNTSF